MLPQSPLGRLALVAVSVATVALAPLATASSASAVEISGARTLSDTVHVDFTDRRPGGIRADLKVNDISSGGEAPGEVTYGEAFTVQPFGNSLVVKTLTGAQIRELLEQQFAGRAAAARRPTGRCRSPRASATSCRPRRCPPPPPRRSARPRSARSRWAGRRSTRPRTTG